MTTLRDLLADSRLGLELLVDGDVDKTIRWVHVTELVDASPYLVGDEFILTAGVWRGRRHSAEDFVTALSRRDVAAIGYGLLEGDDEVPAPVVKACREHHVPLVLVPVRTPFVAITQWFVDRLTEERERVLVEALEFRENLLRVADLEDPKNALTQIARLLRWSLDCEVLIFDDSGRELARGGKAPAAAIRAQLLAGATPDGWSVHSVNGRQRASIAVAAAGDDLEVRSRLDAARPVVGLVLARQRAVRESERRIAGEVVSLVLGRQVEAAAVRLSYYGLNPAGRLVAVVCAVDDRDRALRAAERWLDEQLRGGIAALRSHELMLMLDAGAMDAADLHDAASNLGRQVGAQATGTGPIVDSVGELRRSLVQARHACELGRRRGGGIVVSHDLSSDHTLLLALQDQDVLDTFRDSLLAQLIAYDAEHGSNLEETLSAFLETGGRWQETADLLHVHVNTLRHRLARVEQLTGRKVDSTPDRVDLWLALKAATAGTPGT